MRKTKNTSRCSAKLVADEPLPAGFQPANRRSITFIRDSRRLCACLMPGSSTNKTSDCGKPPAQAGKRGVPQQQIGSQTVMLRSFAPIALPPTSLQALDADAAAAEARRASCHKAGLVTPKWSVEFPVQGAIWAKCYARLDGETGKKSPKLLSNAASRVFWSTTSCPKAKLRHDGTGGLTRTPGSGVWGIRSDSGRRQRPLRPARRRLGYFADADAVRFGRERTGSDGVRRLPQVCSLKKRRLKSRTLRNACLAVLLQNDYPQDIIAAVLATVCFVLLTYCCHKLRAVAAFEQLPKPPHCAAAIRARAKPAEKAGAGLGEVNESLPTGRKKPSLPPRKAQPKIAAAVAEDNFKPPCLTASVKPWSVAIRLTWWWWRKMPP